MEKELKTEDQRKFEFTNSYSTKDYWKYYQKISKKISYELYKEVLDFILIQFADTIANGAYVWQWPCGFGKITVTKILSKIIFEGDKLVSHFPVDYKATKELWAEDEEARNNKQLVYCLNNHTNHNIFRIKYCFTSGGTKKSKAGFLKYRPARKLTRQFAKNIKDHLIN